MVGYPILPSAQLPTKWTLSSVPALDRDGLTVQARLIVSHKILSLGFVARFLHVGKADLGDQSQYPASLAEMRDREL